MRWAAFGKALKGGTVSGQALVYVCAAAFNAIIPFLLLPFLARWLGPSDFGNVGSFVALVSILAPLIGLNAYGLISVIYFKAGADQARQQTSSAILIVLVMALALSLAGLLFRHPISHLVELPAEWIWAIAAAAAAQGVMTIGLTVAQTTGRALVYGVVQIGYALLMFVACLLLIGAFDFGWEGRLLAQILAGLTVAVIVIGWLARARHLAWPLHCENLRSSLRFGLPLLPHSLAAVVIFSTDRLILANTVGQAQVGIYYLAYQIASLLLLLGTALNQAWLPWLYARLAGNSASEQREIRKALIGIAVVLAIIALAIALLAPLLVLLTGGAGFEQSLTPLRLLAPAMAFQAWYLFASGFLFYHGRTGLLSAITCSVAALQIGAMLALSRHGVTGVASGFLLASLTYAVVTTLAGLRIHPLSKRSTAAGLPTA